MTAIEPKKCLSCNKIVKGRIDKKFCDDYCRNNYNNVQKNKTSLSSDVRNINNALLKNYKILMACLPDNEEMVKVSHDKLLLKGFSFKYHTHSYTTQKKQTYIFCYNYGYLPLDNATYLIVRRKEE